MNDTTIIWDNRQTPISRHFGDVYFNTEGAIAEISYVFIQGNKITERFLAHNHDTFVVAETGFGSGLNFLILWDCFLQFRQKNPGHKLKQLLFYSVEKYPLSKQEHAKVFSKIFTQQDKQLQLLSKQLLAKQLLTKQSNSGIKQNSYAFDKVTLNVLIDDISAYPAFLKKQNCLVDAWFFDGFSPQKNPEMWSEALVNACYSLTHQSGTFATFTAASFVRKQLIAAGFTVEKRKGYGVKREMLIGRIN